MDFELVLVQPKAQDTLCFPRILVRTECPHQVHATSGRYNDVDTLSQRCVSAGAGLKSTEMHFKDDVTAAIL